MTDYKTYRTSKVSAAQETESPLADNFNTFLQMNSGIGYLIFEVYNDSPVTGRVPIPNAKITVSRPMGDNYYLSKIVVTDENGETVPLSLPAVKRELSLQPGEGRVFTNYHVSVEAPGFQRKDVYDVQIFDGITAVQRVPLRQIPQSRSAGTAPAPILTE